MTPAKEQNEVIEGLKQESLKDLNEESRSLAMDGGSCLKTVLPRTFLLTGRAPLEYEYQG